MKRVMISETEILLQAELMQLFLVWFLIHNHIYQCKIEQNGILYFEESYVMLNINITT